MCTAEPDDAGRLSPTEDLNIALHMISSFQGTIQHADAKAGMLFAGQAVLTGTTATTTLEIRPQWVAWLFTTVFLLALTGSLWHLAIAVLPRLSGPTGVNRFSLPQLAGASGQDSTVSRQREDAWRLAAALATIAIEKHQRIQRAIPCVGLTVLAFLGRALLAGQL